MFWYLINRWRRGFKKAASFIRELKTVENIEILPYHTMGTYKWEN